MTRQVHLLEAELQTQLFERHSRGVDLTENGRSFLSRARSILREAERTRYEFRAKSGTVSGPVALAIAPAMVDVVLGPIIADYTRDYPDVTVEIVEGFTGYIEEWLVDGRVDLALLYDPRSDKRIRKETLVREQLFVVGPPELDLRPDKGCPLASLQSHRIITASRDQRLREVVEEAAARAGIPLTIGFEANSLTVHKALIRQELGVSFLPYGAVAREVSTGTLSAAPVIAPDIEWSVTLATPALSRLSAAARILADTIRAAVAELSTQRRWPGQA